MTDQLVDTNRTRMEHILLSAITIGPKYLAISSAQLGDKLIVNADQAIAPIDRQRHGNQEFPFQSQKSGNKMNVDFGRKADEKIGMIPPRTIGSPLPTITRTRQGSFKIFYYIIGKSDIAFRGLPWNVAEKSEIENLGGTNIFENAERENSSEVEKAGRKNSVNWDNTYSVSINEIQITPN